MSTVSMPRRAGTTFLPIEQQPVAQPVAQFQCPEGLVPFSNMVTIDFDGMRVETVSMPRRAGTIF